MGIEASGPRLRVLLGRRNALTPSFNCAIRFSWLQRSLAKYTTSAQDQSRWLLM